LSGVGTQIIGPALGQSIDFAGVDVEARDLDLLLAVEQGQGKPNVAKADDSNASLALLDPNYAVDREM
jgi:hypothetical protein